MFADWIERLRHMSPLQRILALVGSGLAGLLFVADALGRLSDIIQAPANALSFWQVISKMIASTSLMAWVVLLVSFACFVVATAGVWVPFFATPRLASAPSGPTTRLSPIDPLLPYDVDARSALLYAANGSWTLRPDDAGLDGAEVDRIYAALDKFYELASSGSLRVWGRKDRTRPPMPVETTHWQDWHINYVTLFSRRDDDPIRTVPRDTLRGSPYFDLRLNKSEVERCWPHNTAIAYGRAVAPPLPRPKFGSFAYKNVIAQWRRDEESYRLVVVVTLTNENDEMLAYQLAGSVKINDGAPSEITTESLLHIAARKDASIILTSVSVPWQGDKESAIIKVCVRYSIRYDLAETWPRDLVYHDKLRTTAKTIRFDAMVARDPMPGASQQIIPTLSDEVET
jgi:hypothetical protein